MAPKPPRKGIKSNRPPFYTSKGFVAAVVVVALSILLTLEPVANLVDDLLRQLTGHEKTRRSLSMTQAAEQLCKETNDCRAIASNAKFQVTVTNESPYRADIYYDNGGFGKQIATVEANGGKESLDVYRDNLFFVTRHGVKEGLFDPETEEQHKFITTMNGQTFVIPENARPSDNLCQDRFSVCSDYAKRGQCWDSPGWMIVHCCKSCDSVLDAGRLIDPNARCTKENLNITDPIWHPGDLHKLFTSWVTSESFSQYEPQVLSSPGGAHGGKEGPWVITFDNFFTEEEAQALIKGGAEAGFERSTNQGSVNALGEMEMVKSTTRTSSNAWCIGACQRIPQVRTVTARIEKVTDIPEKNYEPFQILEYQDNQFYKMHHDSEGRDTKPPGNRILTFFLYLSDVEEGGETKFNKLDLAVKPKRGRALVWPSVLNEEPDFWDDRMYHEAMPVIKGTKFAANHWIHLNDYEGPNLWGCTGSFS